MYKLLCAIPECVHLHEVGVPLQPGIVLVVPEGPRMHQRVLRIVNVAIRSRGLLLDVDFLLIGAFLVNNDGFLGLQKGLGNLRTRVVKGYLSNLKFCVLTGLGVWGTLNTILSEMSSLLPNPEPNLLFLVKPLLLRSNSLLSLLKKMLLVRECCEMVLVNCNLKP